MFDDFDQRKTGSEAFQEQCNLSEIEVVHEEGIRHENEEGHQARNGIKSEYQLFPHRMTVTLTLWSFNLRRIRPNWSPSRHVTTESTRRIRDRLHILLGTRHWIQGITKWLSQQSWIERWSKVESMPFSPWIYNRINSGDIFIFWNVVVRKNNTFSRVLEQRTLVENVFVHSCFYLIDVF